jgi:hypothetical protein
MWFQQSYLVRLDELEKTVDIYNSSNLTQEELVSNVTYFTKVSSFVSDNREGILYFFIFGIVFIFVVCIFNKGGGGPVDGLDCKLSTDSIDSSSAIVEKVTRMSRNMGNAVINQEIILENAGKNHSVAIENVHAATNIILKFFE